MSAIPFAPRQPDRAASQPAFARQPERGALAALPLAAFVLPLAPAPKPRPRLAGRGGFPRLVKTKSQARREAELVAALLPHAPAQPWGFPLAVRFAACLAPAKSLGRERRRELIASRWHFQTPDVDNLAKQLLDCMTLAAFWEDDRLVAEISGCKVWAEEACWSLEIWRLA